MGSVIAISFAVVAAYLIGSFPTSFILAKLVMGIDIRQSGSKNAGATNVFRVVGKMPGLVTLCVDVLKGVLVVTVIAAYFYRYIDIIDYVSYRAVLGFAAVCGHIWPVTLRFKGGKGVATTLGVGIVVAPAILLITVLVWLGFFLMTSYVSLASIISLMLFPILCAVFDLGLTVTVTSVLICGLVIYKHSANIERLMKGKESKTFLFK